MESRVMGNCHARFGAGENLEERVCSLRLHTSPKRLPIAILRDGRFCYGGKTAGTVPEIHVCRSESFDPSVGKRVSAPVSECKIAGGKQKGL